jgi:hypothetical protein
MTRPLPLLAAALVFALVSAAAARADEKSEAEAAMAQANESLQKREYEAAIRRFRDALRFVPTASGPFLGLGLAYAATDRCEKAIDALEEYLRRRSRDPKPEAKAALDGCRARVNEPGRLRVETVPPGVEVRIDTDTGAPAGATPFELPSLARGPHRVHLNHAGFKPYVAEVRVEPGMLALVSVPLEPLPPTVIALPAPRMDDNLLMPAPDSGLHPLAPGNEGAAPAPTAPSSATTPAQVVTITPLTRPAPAAAPESEQRALLTRVQEGRLMVVASVQPASIYVNGERVSRDGRADLDLPPGLYGVTVERDGFLGAAGSLTVGSGERRSYTAELRPIKRHAWNSVGALFTVLAVATEGAAIAGHVLADRSIAGSSDFQTFHALELYGHVGAGCGAGIAVLSFLIDYLVNRGHVDEGAPFPLTLVSGDRR